MRRRIAVALAVAAVVAGVWVGLWEAHWVESPCPSLPIGSPGQCDALGPEPQFAWWVCALAGAGVAAVIALIALAVDRWPPAEYSTPTH